MNIQIFGLRKSFDTKKAERWFKERRIKYQYIDLESKGLSAGEYRSIKAAVGYEALVNKNCRAYEELYMAQTQYKADMADLQTAYQEGVNSV